MKLSPYINPLKAEDVYYWTKKWDISQSDLYNAIIDTGSNNVNTLKENLKAKGLYHFTWITILRDVLHKFKLR